MHRAAGAQATRTGRSLSSLAVIAGRVYAGYGDFDANTGPIHIESLSASSPLGEWRDDLTVATEQIAVYRELGDGRIIVPQVDPQGSGVGYAERSVGCVWIDEPQRIASDGQHVLDMVEFGGRLWACGSDGDDAHDYAVAWHSADAGATWVESLRDPVSVVGSRFFFFAAVGDTLYVRNDEQDHAFAWTAADGWQPSSIDAVPSGVTGGPGCRWASGAVLPSALPNGDQFDLYFFDGTTSARIAEGINGWALGDDGLLYTVDPDGLVSSYDTPESSPVLRSESTPVINATSSLCILPGSREALVGMPTSAVRLVALT